MIRIAHFIYDSPKNPWLAGGGSFRNMEIYKRFSSTGFRVDIFSGDFHGARDEAVYDNVFLFYLGRKTRNYVLSRFFFVLKARKYVKINKAEYDLFIDDFSPFSPLFLFPLVRKDRLVGQIQNFFGFKHHVAKLNLAGLPTCFFEWVSLKSYRQLLFTSHDLRDIVLHKIPVHNGTMAVVPYGISDEIVLDKREYRKKDYMLFLGRLEIYQKGIDFLIRCFPEIQKHHPSVKLLIAGSGKDEKRIRRLIRTAGQERNIEMIGRVEGLKKIEVLSEALFTVMPSRYESWGIVSLESQACGTPVIAAEISGLRETLVHEKTGLLFKQRDEFIRYCSLLLKDASIRVRLASGAVEWARKFTWDELARKQETFYSQVLEMKE
jgi:glycogen synthase